MAEIDELERLSSLHASGGLTEDEFTAAKAKLLRQPPKVHPLIIGALAALAVAVLILLAVVLSTNGRDNSIAPKRQVEVALPPAAIPTPEQPAAATEKPTKLNSLFNVGRIGGYLPKFESEAGLPSQVFGDDRYYEVDGCTLVVGVSGQSIRSMSLTNISPSCLPTEVLGANRPWSFGKAEKRFGGGTYSASCLTSCGNAADPSIYLTMPGSHAQGFIDVRVSAQIINGPIMDAADKWEAAMKEVEGDDYIVATKFNCDRKYDALAHRVFSKIQITEVTIGTVPTDRCS